MLSLRGERVMNLLTIMEHAALSLQLCGFCFAFANYGLVSCLFFVTAANRKTSISRA